VTENSAINEAEKIALSKVTLGSFMYTSDFIKVPYSLLRDSFVDFNMIVTDVIAERVGRVINTHATIGTGSGQPTGIVTASTQGVAAAASAITLDNILGLVHSVDPAYRGANSKFMLNDSTLMAIRTLKDGQGRYVWDMGNITQGVAPTLWGYGYQINQDMPSIGTGLKSMLFGDMSKYRIRKVGGARLKRLEERFVENDQVAFVYLEAFDGNLLDTKAVKALVHA
jgi:HK97 family phage major capsid protein